MKKTKLNLSRLVLCAVVLCVLVCGLVYLYAELMDVAQEKLEMLNPKVDGDVKNFIWLVEKIAYIIPVPMLLLAQMLIYKIEIGVSKNTRHRECAWELIVAFIFAYAVLLPLIVFYSKSHPVQPGASGAEAMTQAERTIEWFMWQLVIFPVPILYHRVSVDPKEDNDEIENEVVVD